MGIGKVNSGDFRNGTPIILPHQFGNPVSSPEPFGNVMPQANSSLNSNPVTWTPSATQFGNNTAFSMQVVPPILIVEHGGTGSAPIVVTELGGFTGAVTLTSSGAPSGAVVSFTINPTTGATTAQVTVSSAVPSGKYTITVTGTSGTAVNSTNIQLVVVGVSLPSNAFGFLLENGTGVILLENGSILLLENQS